MTIRPVWSESSLYAQCLAKGPSVLRADSEDSDQTGRMPSWSEFSLSAHAILLGLWWGGSFVDVMTEAMRAKNTYKGLWFVDLWLFLIQGYLSTK